jgi:hypothetical protein
MGRRGERQGLARLDPKYIYIGTTPESSRIGAGNIKILAGRRCHFYVVHSSSVDVIGAERSTHRQEVELARKSTSGLASSEERYSDERRTDGPSYPSRVGYFFKRLEGVLMSIAHLSVFFLLTG